MSNTKQAASESEDNDQNKQEPHDPVAAGRAAIEASKVADGKDPSAPPQEEDKKDAEQWRNEG